MHRNLECQVHESRLIESGQTRDGKSAPDFHCHCLYLGLLSHNLLLRLIKILHFAFLTPAMFAHRLILLNSLDKPSTAQVLLGMQFWSSRAVGRLRCVFVERSHRFPLPVSSSHSAAHWSPQVK